MRTITGLLVRALVIAICGLALWKSAQLARADYFFSPGTTAGLDRALDILPADVDYMTRRALRKIDDGEDSADVDAALLKASRMNPVNSTLVMALGIRAENRGDLDQAEQFLLRAAELDHQYKPAWTMANFCMRTGRMEHFWPMARRCLQLEPSGFDPTAVYDLCWRVTDDAGKIQGIVPHFDATSTPYLLYLAGTKRWDAALAWWPVALESLDQTSKPSVDGIIGFTESLIRAERVPDAVRIWNQLVERGLVKSGKLEPASGISIADPEFAFARNAGAFSWHVTEGPGIFPASDFSALRVEFDGTQPQAFRLLSTSAPVLAQRKYKLSWKSDGSRLSQPSDPGFVFRVLCSAGTVLTECQPLLSGTGGGSCTFESPAGGASVQVELQYARASGTTRSSGVLEISVVRLEFGS